MEKNVSAIPASSKVSISFIALSFLAFVLYFYLLSHTEGWFPLLDWLGISISISIHLAWFSLLAWVARNVHRRNPNAKSTLLLLACIVGLLAGFEFFSEADDSLLLAAVNAVEALFLLAAYLSFPKIEGGETTALKAHVGFAIPGDKDIASRMLFHFSGLGYRLTEEQPNAWVFQRGNKLAALWRFDIRAYATKLTVRPVTQQDGGRWLSCDWEVDTGMSITTGGDVRKLEAEGRQLEAVLGGQA